MNCSSCQHVNRPGRRFCVECGAALDLVCPACEAPCDAGEKFCGDCGEPLPTARPRRGGSPRADAPGESTDSAPVDAGSAAEGGARKVVTIVFADLVGSTALHERIDAESAHRLMDHYYEALRGAVEQGGGTVVKLLGDGVMAAFGLRQVAEDDALRAVRAAAEMQRAFASLAEQRPEALADSGLRVAVNTGEVVVSSGHDDLIGDPVNVAARLQEQGRNGDVVLGDETRRLVAARVTLAPLGSVALKGRSEAVAAYRLVSLEPPAAAAVAPFVGREDELRRLDVAYEVARATPVSRLAVVLGSPGLGKSRLLEEFMRRCADEATILSAHCDAAGGDTFAPLAVAFRSLLGLAESEVGDSVQAAIEAALAGEDDADRTRVARGIGDLLAGSPAPPEESFFVIRRFLVALARPNPLVLVIDDLQWAEPLLLDLLEHLVQWGGDVPLFIVAGARPELRELRSTLVVQGRLVGDVVTLGGLDAAAAMRLAANVVGATDLPAAVAGKVLATSEGNPLFVSELVRMLVQEGALTREGDRWTVGVGLAALEMPPTIHALLAARIERLRPEERAVLERAAVVGRTFSRAAVAALRPEEAGDLDSRLEALIRSELLERDAGWFLGEPALRFHHLLIRDAAYRRLLKGTRAELHAGLADWVEGRVGDAAEHDETVGRHLEQAHLLLRELGPLDDRARALGERAAGRLSAAGRRALARDDLDLAAGLLGRSVEVLGRPDPNRAELALDWCEALLSSGDVAPASGAIDELTRFADGSPRLEAWRVCFASQLAVLTAPDSLQTTADEVAVAGAVLAELGDANGEAKAHAVHAAALVRLGKVAACEAALDRALAAARRAGDRRRANAVLSGAPVAALWGPSPVTRASGRCLDVVRVLRITQGAPAVEAVALACQGVLEALRGRTDAARRMLGFSRKIVEDLGVAQRIFEVEVLAARIELLESKAPEAEALLRRAYDGLRDLGLGIDAARAAALLARSLLVQGNASEAETISHEVEQLAGDDLQASIAWRGVRAEALSARGQHEEAIALARAAVHIAAATDALLDHAEARLALAVALRAAGLHREADAEEGRGIDLWDSKGATLLVSEAGQSRRSGKSGTRKPPMSMPPPATVRRRPRPNLATATMERLECAIGQRDEELLRSLYADSVRAVEDLNGVEYGLEGCLSTFRLLMEMDAPAMSHLPLATFGQHLLIARRRVSAGGGSSVSIDVGAVDRETITVLETDVEGRVVYKAGFLTGDLGRAVLHFLERSASSQPEGPERERASRMHEAVSALLSPSLDLDAVAAGCSPDIEALDHRPLAVPGRRGVEAVVGGIQDGFDLAEASVRVPDVLALETEALLAELHVTGRSRESGSEFELRTLLLVTFGEDGRMERWESFETADAAKALARFRHLTGKLTPEAESGDPRPAPQRLLGRNRATETLAAMNAAFVARDFDTFARPADCDYQELDHTNGAVSDWKGATESVLRFAKMEAPVLRYDALATLGDSLALSLRVSGAAGTGHGRFDVAAFAHQVLCVSEADVNHRLRRNEVFGAESLSDAITRLYERFAELLPDGPDRTTAEARARVVRTLLRETDVALGEESIADEFEMVDRRVLGTWSAQGREEGLRHMESLFDLAERIEFRHTDVLALRPEGLLVRREHEGVRKGEGGAYARSLLALMVLGEDGRMVRIEMFDPHCEAEALARFEEVLGKDDREVTIESPSASSPGEAAGSAGDGLLLQARFENLATSASRAFDQAWAAKDWAAIEALILPGYVLEDRRSYAHLELDRDQHLASLRERFEMETSRYSSEVVATRGETLCLVRSSFELAGGDVGTSRSDSLIVMVANVPAQFRRLVTFDADDLVSARACLEELYEAGEADGLPPIPSLLLRGISARDWPAVEGLCSPVFVQEDRRHLSLLGTTRGAEAWVRNFQAIVEIAPDTVPVFHHARSRDGAHLMVASWQGTQLGGAYEIPLILLFEWDGSGKIVRGFMYDLDQMDDAWEHFQAVASALTGPDPFANEATESFVRFSKAWSARDWDAVASIFSPESRLLDRRSYAHLELGRDQQLEALRVRFNMALAHYRFEILATRGTRLALGRHVWKLADGDVGASESESLLIGVIDSSGVLKTCVAFDSDQLEAAYAELDALYEAEEGADDARLPALAWARAAAAHDWEAMRSLLAPDLRVRDRRALSLHGTMEGPEAFLQLPIRLVELAPDSRPRLDHVRTSGRCGMFSFQWAGSRDGGDYEIPLLAVYELREDGKLSSVDLLDQEQVDEAVARLAERSAADTRPLPFANQATGNVDATLRTFMNMDPRQSDPAELREALGASFAESFRYVDRRSVAHLDLSRDEYFLFMSENNSAGWRRGTWKHLATRGERLCLFRLQVDYSGGVGVAAVGESELEFLCVVEVDAAGATIAHVRFDVADVEAAYVELDRRFLAGEDGGYGVAKLTLMDEEAARRGDWETFSRTFDDDFRPVDHRVLGFGDTLSGVAEFVDTQKALYELAPDSHYRTDHLRSRGRAVLGQKVQMGTREGGAFESHFLSVLRLGADERWKSLDVYDLDHFDDAMARFLELAAIDEGAAAPTTAPTTPIALATSRVIASEAEGWDTLRSIAADDFRWEDRRRLFGISGDLDLMVSSLKERTASGLRSTSSVVSEAGDRVGIRRILWSGGSDDGRVEIEFLLLTEVDEAGKLKTIVVFDLDDRLEAQREAWKRWAAIDPSVAEPLAMLMKFMEGFDRRDSAVLRPLMAEDLAVVDHRHAAMEEMQGGDAYFKSIAVLWELAPQQRLEHGSFVHAIAPWGVVSTVRRFGEIADGGPFESVYLNVVILRDGRVSRSEFFECEDLEAAKARWWELRPKEDEDAAEPGRSGSVEAVRGDA